MTRLIGAVAVGIALAVVVVAFLLPVGSLFLESVRLNEVVLKDGRVIPAVGDVQVTEDRVILEYQAAPGEERTRPPIRPHHVEEVRTRFSLRHYSFVFRDQRLFGLLLNSLQIALGGALLALLLGMPLGWLLFRTDLPGRPVLLALCLSPAILPPFLVALGGARRLMNVLQTVFGLEGVGLHLASAVAVFGIVLSPLVILLVGRALAAVPVGPYEAARMLGGRSTAWRYVVVPAVLPAVFGAGALVFVLAWSDFTVPDLLSFMLPPGSATLNVFPTEILLQWKQSATARAVAMGAPYVLVTACVLVVAIVLLRKTALIMGGEGRRGRLPVRLSTLGRILGWLGVAVFVTVGLVLPLYDMAGWASGQGESVARTGDAAAEIPTSREGRLFDFRGAFERTPKGGEHLARWLRMGVLTALLATLLAVILARWALRGGALARTVVLLLAALPLAVPGIVYGVATATFWNTLDAPWIERTIFRSVLALTARFLPFAILAAWAVLREVRRGHEEAAALLGAFAPLRMVRIWGPLAGWGILGGALAVLVLALRELDTVLSIDTRIFPLRIYEKIHFSRLADEANLAFLYVGILLVPAILATLAIAWGRRRRRA